MAKMKTFSVEVTVTHKRTLFVQARRPQGALERLLSDDGWITATAYQEDDVLPTYPSKDLAFGVPREVE